MTIGIDECPSCGYKGDMNIDSEQYHNDECTEMGAEAVCDRCGSTWWTNYKFTGIFDLEVNKFSENKSDEDDDDR